MISSYSGCYLLSNMIPPVVGGRCRHDIQHVPTKEKRAPAVKGQFRTERLATRGREPAAPVAHPPAAPPLNAVAASQSEGICALGRSLRGNGAGGARCGRNPRPVARTRATRRAPGLAGDGAGAGARRQARAPLSALER